MRGRAKVIAIKENIDLCPWADVVYGCDRPWWEFRRGLKEFTGLKLSFVKTTYPDVRTVKIAAGKAKTYSDDLHFDEVGTIGGGGNSGFQSLNLALQWGARRIILIGYDLSMESGFHWYGRNGWAMANNPDERQLGKWAQNFDEKAPTIFKLGADVVNVSEHSRITAFRKGTIEQVLKEWS